MNPFHKPARIFQILLALALLHAAGASADPATSQSAPSASPPPAAAAGKDSTGANTSKDAAASSDKNADKASGKDSDKESSEGAKAPKRFVPSERSPADSNSTFPVDI